MALISIPSTIGGVTIPGTASSGPLGALFGSQYGLSSLQYPRDLGSMTKGHFIQFSLYQRQPQKYDEITNNNGFFDKAKSFVEGSVDAVSKVTTLVKESNAPLLSFSKDVVSKPDIISLYMPDTVNITNNSKYSDVGLLSAISDAAKTVGGLAKTGSKFAGVMSLPAVALSTASDSKMGRILLQTQGLALNPKNQLLFEGIDFRTYQLAFTFTPYSAEEAETVKQIIKTFKKHAAPTIITETAGMFFRPPSTVGVQFMFNGKENTNIAKVTESVIESVDVNYAPNGWAAHDNGAPVQTTLTLQMKEIQLIDSVMIDKQGF